MSLSFSFRQRVLLLVAGLVVLAQLATLAAVLTTIEREVHALVRGELERGAERLSQLVHRRSALLLNSAEVLAADYGFRSAIASGDEGTILSALDNNVARIDADLAHLIGLDGRLLARSSGASGAERGTFPRGDIGTRELYRRLAARAEADGVALDTGVIDGRARQVVVVPVKAPLTVGWLLLGFSLDDALARELGAQIGMQVSFASGSPAGTDDRDPAAVANARAYHGSTLAPARRRALPAAMHALVMTDSGAVAALAGERFLTREVDIGDRPGAVSAILQSSLDAALAGYRRVRDRLILLGALFLGIALVLAVRFARGVTRPLERLSAAVSRTRDGDYATPPDIDRDDELGRLADAFADMQSGIAEREATILHRALHDELTQLPNRRLGRDRLERCIDRSRREGRPLAVVLIGIVRYRQIVETLGHAVGEHLLRETATRLTARARDADTVARVGADEFMLVLHDTDAEGTERCLDALLPALAAPVRLEAAELLPDPVAGIVRVPEHADEAGVAMHRASIALADARESGAARLPYAVGGDERHLKRLALVADLKRAVARDELTLYFQPKVRLADDVAHSCEALVRWIHPEHGFMPPDEFIGLAESSGNISLLTDWVLGRAIGQVAAWRSRGIDIAVAVNLSALDLQDEALPVRIAAMLARHALPPSALILEVTESTMMRDTERALALLGVLRASGITLSIDDFGTGYSSLAKLRDLPIDELKIDRAFVTGIETGSVEALIVRTIIELGHGLGLTIITEGVETEAERDVLAELGCDIVQGYLYSRPLPHDAFAAWYVAHPAHAARHVA